MSTNTDDGQTLPEPLLRATHRYGFFNSSEGRHVSVEVHEAHDAAFLTLTLVAVTEGSESLGNGYLYGIVALRLSEGWSILSSGERHYVLGPPRPRDDAPDVNPACSRCGSDRIVRDACARWDKIARQWVLADVHQCGFCEACNAEGDDLVHWASGDTAQPPAPSAGEGR